MLFSTVANIIVITITLIVILLSFGLQMPQLCCVPASGSCAVYCGLAASSTGFDGLVMESLDPMCPLVLRKEAEEDMNYSQHYGW